MYSYTLSSPGELALVFGLGMKHTGLALLLAGAVLAEERLAHHDVLATLAQRLLAGLVQMREQGFEESGVGVTLRAISRGSLEDDTSCRDIPQYLRRRQLLSKATARLHFPADWAERQGRRLSVRELDFWNTCAKHDSLFQKSLPLSHPFSRHA
jgi:hypothetical protein